MPQRAKGITLSEIAQWCALSDTDPVTTVGELLAGVYERTDLVSLLAVRGTQSFEGSFHVA